GLLRRRATEVELAKDRDVCRLAARGQLLVKPVERELHEVAQPLRVEHRLGILALALLAELGLRGREFDVQARAAAAMGGAHAVLIDHEALATRAQERAKPRAAG